MRINRDTQEKDILFDLHETAADLALYNNKIYVINRVFEYPIFIYIIILLIEILILYITLKESSKMLALNYKSNRQNT